MQGTNINIIQISWNGVWLLNWWRNSLHMHKVTVSRMRERYVQKVLTSRITYVKGRNPIKSVTENLKVTFLVIHFLSNQQDVIHWWKHFREHGPCKVEARAISMRFVRRNIRWHLSAFRIKSQEISRWKSSVRATTKLHHVTFKFAEEITQMVMYWKWHVLVHPLCLSLTHTHAWARAHAYLGWNYRKQQACSIYDF